MDSVIAGDDFDPVAATPSIYFDTDAQRRPVARRHAVHGRQQRSGARTPTPSSPCCVVNDIPGGVVDGNIGFSRLTADSRTGTGAPGTAFAGQGAGGTDAVVGTTGRRRRSHGEYLVAGVTRDRRQDADRRRPVRRRAPGAGRAHQLHASS